MLKVYSVFLNIFARFLVAAEKVPCEGLFLLVDDELSKGLAALVNVGVVGDPGVYFSRE